MRMLKPLILGQLATFAIGAFGIAPNQAPTPAAQAPAGKEVQAPGKEVQAPTQAPSKSDTAGCCRKGRRHHRLLGGRCC